MKKKRIVFYTDCPFVAGSEKGILNIIKYKKLTKQYDIVLIYRYSERYHNELLNLKLNIKTDFVKLINFDNYIINFNYNKPKDVFKRIIILITNIILLSKIYNFFIICNKLYKYKPDIIHINNGGFPGADSCNLLVLIVKKICKMSIYTINNFPSVSKWNFFHKYYIKKISKNIDVITTGSKKNAKYLKKLFDTEIINISNTVSPNKINTLTNPGINRYIKDNSYKIFISAGILTKRKGFLELLNSFNKIYKSGEKKFYLFIFGDGELREDIRSFILNNGLKNNIFLMGFTKNLSIEIIRSDYFILNSLYNEDMPYVLVESLYLGKPIITTRIAGNDEIVFNNLNGYISNPYDEKALTKNINKLINLDSKKIRKYQEYSHFIYEKNFKYEKIMDKYLNIYGKLSN
tara:strand:- start:16738 stop:17952 length:1215 start_codon:yes stop_codon:yes gene_type:complete